MRALTVVQPWCGPIAAGLKLIENRPRLMIRRADFGERFALHAGREVDEPVYDRIRQIAPELWFEQMNDPRRVMAHPSNVETWPSWYRLSRITSAVIATARITRCVVLQDNNVDVRDAYTGELVDLGEQRRWMFGPYGYLVADVRVLAKPVACRGWQGFWHLTPKEQRDRGEMSAVERAVLEQIEEAA